MTQPIYDIAVNQNATFKMSFQLTDSASVPIDITSWSFTGSIKTSVQDTAPLLMFTASADVTQSIVTISLTPFQTNQLTTTSYVYDIIATNIAPTIDEVYRILQGKVKVNLGVTPSTVV
jgi:hypothetical protein